LARQRHILFVCGKARMRSPTAARIAPDLLDCTADFAGLSRDADHPLTPEQIAEANVIAVMERGQIARLKRQVGPLLRDKRVVCLDVPDRFDFMAPELVALLAHHFRRLG
jgi:predicted protein tyrosine phosphatase